MSTLTKQTTIDSTRTATVAAGLVGAISTAAYISSVIFMPDIDAREGATHPLVQVSGIITALSFVALALTLPSLGERLPRWALYVAGAGCAFVATSAWTFGPFMGHVSGLLTDAQGDQFQDATSGYLTAFWLPKVVFCGVGLFVLAIAGWRRRTIARPACVVLALAAIVSVLIAAYPPGAFLTALALAWTARTASGAARTATP
jgi:glucan phosphoethanolaminetransferase (alkaline phosphatase superfamily)